MAACALIESGFWASGSHKAEDKILAKVGVSFEPGLEKDPLSSSCGC